MNANFLFLLNLLTTWYLVGLIWMVQIVHYKLFDRVGVDHFIQYEQDHGRLITPIVALPMLVELATSLALLGFSPIGLPRTALWVAAGMVVGIWVTTFFISVPCHTRLLDGFDETTYRRLVGTNWIRTILWTVRGILMGYFAMRLLANPPS